MIGTLDGRNVLNNHGCLGTFPNLRDHLTEHPNINNRSVQGFAMAFPVVGGAAADEAAQGSYGGFSREARFWKNLPTVEHHGRDLSQQASPHCEGCFDARGQWATGFLRDSQGGIQSAVPWPTYRPWKVSLVARG